MKLVGTEYALTNKAADKEVIEMWQMPGREVLGVTVVGMSAK